MSIINKGEVVVTGNKEEQPLIVLKYSRADGQPFSMTGAENSKKGRGYIGRFLATIISDHPETRAHVAFRDTLLS